MKRIILTTALLAGLSAAPFAAGMSSASAASLAGSISGINGNVHGAQRHNPTAQVHFPNWQETQSMRVVPSGDVSSNGRICDQSKNGTAYLDACSPDGMAAGGSNSGGGRLK